MVATDVTVPSGPSSPTRSSVPSQGIRGWSQAIHATRRPSGAGRGKARKSLPPAISRTAAGSVAAAPDTGTATRCRRIVPSECASRTHQISSPPGPSTGSAYRRPAASAGSGSAAPARPSRDRAGRRAGRTSRRTPARRRAAAASRSRRTRAPGCERSTPPAARRTRRRRRPAGPRLSGRPRPADPRPTTPRRRSGCARPPVRTTGCRQRRRPTRRSGTAKRRTARSPAPCCHGRQGPWIHPLAPPGTTPVEVAFSADRALPSDTPSSPDRPAAATTGLAG